MMMLRIELVFVLLALLSTALGGDVVIGNKKTSTMARELEIERKLKLLNKPAVKSIQSEDGDIIDCVEIHKQPAFDHPLLKNHILKMKPTNYLASTDEEASSSPPLFCKASQLWRKNGSCPEGTIPIRRVQRHHLLNAPSLESYGRKPYHGVTKHEFHHLNQSFAAGMEQFHSNAVLVTAGYQYIGAKATINVWNPRVEADDEYSSGQIWLRNGPYKDYDSIEVGWIVNPSVYGDRRTRLFIYWTIDGGKATGCFDLLCTGFVQTNRDIALGAVLDPLSQTRGPQYGIELYVYKDIDGDNNWWLLLIRTNTTISIGYWPSELFRSLFRSATLVLWGGDVYSPRLLNKPHTATAMGSGDWATSHYRYASFIYQPRMRDMSKSLKYPDPYHAYTHERGCYSAENYAQVLWTEPQFYFGGPGRNPTC